MSHRFVRCPHCKMPHDAAVRVCPTTGRTLGSESPRASRMSELPPPERRPEPLGFDPKDRYTAQRAAAAAAAAAQSPAVVAPRLRRWVTGAAILIVVGLELRARAHGAPTGVLRATMLDVGQGDAAIVDLPDGRAILIDAGGFVGSPVDTGERVIAPVLRARRRSAIAAVVLSHPHPDHFGGIVTGTRSVMVDSFWDTGQGEREGTASGYSDLLAAMRARGVAVLRPDTLCGSHDMGGATVEVLAPCPEPAADRGANDNSFVVRISYGARAFLFVGDAEREEERELAHLYGSRLRADVLKVGHHGSRTSSTKAFLAMVDPEVAVISCGVRNRFGHPAPPTLATFATTRAGLRRTDREGAITITTDGRSLEVRAASD